MTENKEQARGDDLARRDDSEQSAPDWVLADLVWIANKLGTFEIGVTLMAEGLVVSGILISASQFYTRYGQQWQGALGATDSARMVRERWDGFAKESAQSFASDAPGLKVGFIHLRAAQYFSGNVSTPEGGMLWRGRLNAITGWAMGRLGPSSK